MNALAQTTYEPMLVEKLRPHPRNIRHEVTPSEELVASIRSAGVLQPLVVAPHPTLEGDYTVIAGHHRLAAAKKAGLLEVPAVIRHDLAGDEQQIPAMVAENLARKDLTPTEEADAYQTMLSFEGWDVKRVARETGSGARRVRERAKLAGLAEEHRQALDSGQLTLERALAIAALDDHPDLQEQLVEYAGEDSHTWEYYRKDIAAVASWRKDMAKVRKELEAAGVKIVDRPEAPSWRHDYPYERPSTWPMPVEQAAAEGWMAILDEDCVAEAGPLWVREKPTPEELEAELPPEEIAAREAAVQRKARTSEVEEALRPVAGIEAEWIHQIVERAGAGDTAVLQVLGRHFGQAASEDRYSVWASINRFLGSKSNPYTTEGRQEIQQALTGDLVRSAALFTLMALRQDITGLHTWRTESKRNRDWFMLRAELGWELTDAEKDAQALAAELWPPAPADDTDEDDAGAEDGDD